MTAAVEINDYSAAYGGEDGPLPPAWFESLGLRRYRLTGGVPGRVPGEAPGAAPVETPDPDGPCLLDVGYAHRRRPRLWNAPDLRLPASGIVGITGANGCGKTTLLKLILGVHRRHSGLIRRGGRAWRAGRRSRDCAWVMQDVDYQLLGESVWDELLHSSAPGPETERRAAEALDRIGLAALRARHPMTLSGGQKQRLAIALACMKQAPVICLDEPTSGLDLRGMRQIAALLTDLAGQGALILVITHDQEFAELTFDHAISISDGLVSLNAAPIAATAATEPRQPLQQGADHAHPANTNQKTSQIRDLVTMGVFLALFIAIVFACGMLMGALPPVLIFLPVILGVAGGLVFTVLLGKVRRRGAFLASAVLLAVPLVGMAPGGTMAYMTVIGAALAELIYSKLGRGSFRSISIAYAVYMVFFALGEYIPFVWMKKAYLEMYADAGSTVEVARIGTDVLNPTTMIGLCALTVIASVLGCLWGRRLTRKQLKRAGVV
ncbi:MAG: MptD family putative ECF transporter S component [Propionibacteriaceae bacterium]|jgi:putative ECF transporter S component (TIGR02185 family)|nr:MptD family putative ECF transporter S component [Propionibacteriaceae bacterium]